MKKVLILTLLFALGCASKARLYPNAKYKSVGEAQANRDIAQCEAESEQYLADTKEKQIGKSAATGAAMGAVLGVISGGGLRSVGRGAVGGAAVGATAGALSPDQLKRKYVVKCLSDKGYEVLGYD